MAKRRVTIGLIYRPTSNWIAGAYYVQNIISALMACDRRRLPIIKVYCDSISEFDELQNATGYPYLSYKPINYSYGKIWNNIRRVIKKLTGCQIFIPGKFGHYLDRVKFVYPASLSEFYDVRKALGWIPDFQERYLPEFFSEEELKDRDKDYIDYIVKNVPLVFSSHDALNDFNKFYPQGCELQKFVLPFAVTHPDFSHEDSIHLKSCFGITKQYLFCANQFWVHKNHLFLFKAFMAAKERGLNMQLVCSGMMHEYRNNHYQQEILDFIQNNQLSKDIILTGFIERTEQLCLMNNSYAIVQPSLFEGWSTVVEDAKCLNKFIFLSDLRVHREQNPKNVCFFDPRNEDDLVEKLLIGKHEEFPYDYSIAVKNFGQTFLKIIDDFKN